jgi:pSer/pThr/pTyr-binding forkhead associated (FHA) protein
MSAQRTETTATLVALRNDIQPNSYKLEALCTIGRDPRCQVHVDITDRAVSRVHATIELNGPRYLLSDKDSTNGTFVNGSRIRSPYRLSNQDCIGLGSKTPILRFDDHDPTECTLNSEWLDYDETNMWFYLLDRRVELPIQQFRLLLYLYRHVGEACTREQCAAVVWTEDFTPTQLSNLDETIRKLRENLCQALPEDLEDRGQIVRDVREKLITTRRGIGYALYLHPDDADIAMTRRH